MTKKGGLDEALYKKRYTSFNPASDVDHRLLHL